MNTVSPSPEFQALMGEVMAGAERFGHRQHVQLTWLAVRRHGVSTAADVVGEGIRATATAAGAPQKFHVTMTRAWVELVAHHAAALAEAADSFDAFARSSPELLDRTLLSRFYRPATLAGDAARTGWVEPDLAPFPWQHT
ncbi:hypothetical protein [Streptacidiphilus jiangxiensis]|uniref:Uncharacterized protein n=1 Tax=Streptacidiphilus jiangxiensis TaxID=235985 RepID=A0A1H7NAF0_STRJI|nr:hypothetical protein [Streptacidiphilus jiangxiensis]SEL20444.1 hypothetical protein SAMN05414137_106286 [Streptacidiphilus jiangxiensis]